MENKKPKVIGKSFNYLGLFGKYVLGFRQEDSIFIVGNEQEKEKEFENIFLAVQYIFINCDYEIREIKGDNEMNVVLNQEQIDCIKEILAREKQAEKDVISCTTQIFSEEDKKEAKENSKLLDDIKYQLEIAE